ncbi:MAG: end-binding protein Ku [Solirubrobacterales bacterium]|jgi:DNA end-binding protein Ku|nr:end-binding protein Ku [Solirubrobacterales bacterium]
MARSIWSGSISFGLLNVPVKLYSAVARRNIALREVRESDSARIKHRRVAEGTDEEVPYDKIVKAYEITNGRYVQLSSEEMDALRPEKSRSIDVQDFVDIEEIDPMYFNSPYYLGPAEGAEKAYSLLAAAMESSGKAAIARFVFRNKEHLAAIRAQDGVLTLTTMRFADEVVPSSELDDAFPEKKGKVAKKEQQMAEALIDSLSTKFDPTSYRDEYREELLSLIEQKAEGKEIVALEAEKAEATKAPDLMAALEESIAAVKEKRGDAKSPAKSAPKPASKKSSAKSRSASKAKAKPKKAKAKKAKPTQSKKTKASK